MTKRYSQSATNAEDVHCGHPDVTASSMSEVITAGLSDAERAERYCLFCERYGHRTVECTTGPSSNTTRDRELASLVRASTAEGARSGKTGPEMVLMPRRLTASNGAKALLSGEFSEKLEIHCSDCDADSPESDCAVCGGEGRFMQAVTVEWDTIKRIYEKAVEALGTSAAVVPAVKADTQVQQLAGSIAGKLEAFVRMVATSEEQHISFSKLQRRALELTSEMKPACDAVRPLFPPLDKPIYTHPQLGPMWDRFEMHLYASQYGDLVAESFLATIPVDPEGDVDRIEAATARSVFLSSLRYLYGRDDGSYVWPAGQVGHLLRLAKREFEKRHLSVDPVPDAAVDSAVKSAQLRLEQSETCLVESFTLLAMQNSKRALQTVMGLFVSYALHLLAEGGHGDGADLLIESAEDQRDVTIHGAKVNGQHRRPVSALPNEQQILNAAEEAGLLVNTVHLRLSQLKRYHEALARMTRATH